MWEVGIINGRVGHLLGLLFEQVYHGPPVMQHTEYAQAWDRAEQLLDARVRRAVLSCADKTNTASLFKNGESAESRTYKGDAMEHYDYRDNCRCWQLKYITACT